MTFEDIASVENFIGSVERISENFALIKETIKLPRRELQQAKFNVSNVEPVVYFEENKTIYGQFYLRTQLATTNKWFLAWGIHLPNGFYKKELPPVSHAFLEFGNHDDEADYRLPLGRLEGIQLGEWRPVWEGRELLLAKPFSEFPSDPEKLAEELADWVSKGMTSAVPIIIRLAQAAGQ